eukprot:TRINITY_DN2069_c0_g3_i2.p1 TRINITY_DN2069_c0_g3~~TRINITY_DN2069_c0_g3_i2.p1  ORF type:complete len:371 (+),score=84.44 TRINITY_DN2069_c0_g3_i2:89-1114(+)
MSKQTPNANRRTPQTELTTLRHQNFELTTRGKELEEYAIHAKKHLGTIFGENETLKLKYDNLDKSHRTLAIEFEKLKNNLLTRDKEIKELTTAKKKIANDFTELARTSQILQAENASKTSENIKLKNELRRNRMELERLREERDKLFNALVAEQKKISVVPHSNDISPSKRQTQEYVKDRDSYVSSVSTSSSLYPYVSTQNKRKREISLHESDEDEGQPSSYFQQSKRFSPVISQTQKPVNISTRKIVRVPASVKKRPNSNLHFTKPGDLFKKYSELFDQAVSPSKTINKNKRRNGNNNSFNLSETENGEENGKERRNKKKRKMVVEILGGWECAECGFCE